MILNIFGAALSLLNLMLVIFLDPKNHIMMLWIDSIVLWILLLVGNVVAVIAQLMKNGK